MKSIFVLYFLSAVLAHRHPETDHEIEVQRALQAAAYHVCMSFEYFLGQLLKGIRQCAPAVESFTAGRKRAFAQRAMGAAGYPSLSNIPLQGLGYQQVFASDIYADLKTDEREQPEQDQEKYMTCSPISETHIQNNTCVLAPEVTEGPYYHQQAHPIRQNIAEFQDGLLLVRWTPLVLCSRC